jgi:FAD/FMN-containing dehydrogenase/Fe-S oxidoreductase
MNTDNALTDLLPELRTRFSGDIRTDLASRVLYSTDASIYQIEPLGVVIPRRLEDLQVVVELAAKYGVPILPRGSGSSLAGQAVGTALVVDCSRWLDKIVEIDPVARMAIVEPGVILTTLNRAAEQYGLQFGPDPASAERATMGGVIGNNATGAHSIRYGMSADHLLAAEVVLADGSLARLGKMKIADALRVANNQPQNNLSSFHKTALAIRSEQGGAIRAGWPHAWRNSAGYRLNYLLPWSATKPPQWEGDHYPPVEAESINLAKLLAGSEGTLAVIRTATVNLVPKPKLRILAVLSYAGVAEACDAVPGLLRSHPSAIELIPRMLIRLARGVPAYARQLDFVRGDPAALLVVEFSGDNLDSLKEHAQALRFDVMIAETPDEQAHIWNVRKVGLGILTSAPVPQRPVAFIEDCAIPVERLGEFVRELERILDAHGTQAAFYAHASAGCLHIRPMIDLRTSKGVSSLRSIAEATLALTLKLGGAMSSEHGDGLLRSEWLRKTYGDELITSFQDLKRAADPKGILNPGKIVDAPLMDSHLRFGSDYKVQIWQPGLNFVRSNGLQMAIEQCNGQGVCRKTDGVMCPSFQATREEKHSTRGRANLLRAMISTGGVPFMKQLDRGSVSAQLERAVHDSLDLCLACKGCTSECPTGVDMPKLKYEFQHAYYQHHCRPPRDYIFAYINMLAKLGAPFGGLVNRITDLGWVKRVAERWLGISSKRIPPHFSTPVHSFKGVSHKDVFESCLYLPDAFTHYFEPQIEAAALDVLRFCGVDVTVLPIMGAGRTLISKGFLEGAKKHAAKILDEIRKHDPQSLLAVVGVEPSEIYTLKDEFLDLLPDRAAEIKALAARTWMIDEYLLRPGANSSIQRILRVANKSPKKPPPIQHPKIKLHGHCYQKSQLPASDSYPIGQAASAELLQAVGYEVDIIPSGCCGMAGAFGYETEHFEVSQAVGELVLFPEVRKAKARGWMVVAPGTSCRAQIADGVDLIPEHSITLVAKALSSLKEIK